MTQYIKDFSDELTTGVFPSDFTERYDTGTATPTVETDSESENNRVFLLDQPAAGYLASWDDVDADANRDNCEILARFNIDTDDDNLMYLIARASGSSGNRTAYMAAFQSNGDLQIFKYVTETFSNMGTGVDADFSSSSYLLWQSAHEEIYSFSFHPANRWGWVRFRVNGTGADVTLQAKWWLDGNPEPPIWTKEHVDSTGDRITAAGWIGVGRAATAGNTYIDYLSVGTNGDAAPFQFSTGTTLRMTNIVVEVAMQLDDPLIEVYNVIREVMHQAANPEIRMTQMGIQVAHEIGFPIASGLGGPINTIN